MALVTCQFNSEVLGISTAMSVILPQTSLSLMKEKKKYPTLFLLHGFGDNHTAWTRYTSIERYAAEYGIAVVMPQVDHSYYTDMKYGKKYWTFLTEELPVLARSYFPLSDQRKDNFVAGLSMGGYGALKWALHEPETFAAAASLSGVTDLAGHVKKTREAGDSKFHPIFGEDSISETPHDLFWLIDKLEESDQPKPILYQSCGTEDFLYENNKKFAEFCEHTTLEITTEFDAGDHEWGYWNKKIQDVLAWLPIHKG